MDGKIEAKLQRLEDNLDKLNELKKLSLEEFKDDFRNTEAAKYLLQTSVEAMIDIANQLIARRKLKKPDRSAEAFEILADNDLLSAANKDKYIVMTKFRNRVVHLYTKVDEDEIYKILRNNLKDYRQFINEIAQII
jgi:uncharacterized protein YutE (UPF0331/DUF86 family)